ncbi:hypothetical protein LEMLEM_LOCUS4920 [Lemmus lemmus]
MSSCPCLTDCVTRQLGWYESRAQERPSQQMQDDSLVLGHTAIRGIAGTPTQACLVANMGLVGNDAYRISGQALPNALLGSWKMPSSPVGGDLQ